MFSKTSFLPENHDFGTKKPVCTRFGTRVKPVCMLPVLFCFVFGTGRIGWQVLY